MIRNYNCRRSRKAVSFNHITKINKSLYTANKKGKRIKRFWDYYAPTNPKPFTRLQLGSLVIAKLKQRKGTCYE